MRVYMYVGRTKHSPKVATPPPFRRTDPAPTAQKAPAKLHLNLGTITRLITESIKASRILKLALHVASRSHRRRWLAEPNMLQVARYLSLIMHHRHNPHLSATFRANTHITPKVLARRRAQRVFFTFLGSQPPSGAKSFLLSGFKTTCDRHLE